MLRKIAILFSVASVIALTVLIAIESPVDPIAYQPPKKPAMTGVLAPNDLLKEAELLAEGKVEGPEDVTVDDQGLLYVGTAAGKVMRILPDNGVETVAVTGGRPLGMMFDHDGKLIVCDAEKGLLSITKDGTVHTLATAAEGVPFKLTDALDIDSNGVIYFTDASDRFGVDDFALDMIEIRPHGRLMQYDPKTRQVEVLITGLCFANGVALSINEDFVLVNETLKYRIWRYWLKGGKAGTKELFIENLPGFPDNISANAAGNFWVALFSVRNDLMDIIHDYPFLKSQLGKLPQFIWVKPKRYGLVLALNENGQILRSLQDPSGNHLCEITSAREHNGFLYLGSLHSNRVGKYALR